MSYTTFDYSDLEVAEVAANEKYSVSFTITNTGKVAGREVAQVYISDKQSSLPRPVKELKGFAKVKLEPGESKTVTVHLDKYAVSFFDERRGQWVAEAGKFEVLVAASSEDLRLSGTFEWKKTVSWTGL